MAPFFALVFFLSIPTFLGLCVYIATELPMDERWSFATLTAWATMVLSAIGWAVTG